MRSEKAYAGRLFAVCVALLLVLVSFSQFANVSDTAEKDDVDPMMEEELESSTDIDEATKYYHERGQDSFGGSLDIGSAVGPIYDIAVGDLDNDGDEDIITSSTGFPIMFPALIIIWENDGTPFDLAWSSAIVASFGVGPEDVINSIDIADLDNDGDLDIVAGYNNTANNVLIWGNPLDFGAGAPFADPWVGGMSGFIVGSSPGEVNEVAVGDLNWDGNIDIVSVHNDLGGMPVINIWNNSGDPFGALWGFQGLTMPAPGGAPRISVAVGDFDNDGDLDIVTGDPGGSIQNWENPLEMVDPFTVLWSGGIGNPIHAGFDPPNSIDVGDIDNDGDLDVAVGYYGFNAVEVIIENPFESVDPMANPWLGINIGGTGPVWELTLGDLDNDGWLDTMTSNEFANVQGSENDQSPWDFGWQYNYVGDVGATGRSAVALADFDNDGDLDVAAGDSAASTFVWNNTLIHRNMPLNTSMPASTNTGPIMASMPVRALDTGDIDNDGDLDAVTCSMSDSGNLYVWNNSTPWDPNLWDATSIDTNLFPPRFVQDCRLADLDNDGDLDVVAGGSNIGATVADLRIWENPYNGGTGNPFSPTAFPWSGGVGVEISGGIISFPPSIATFLSLDVADFDNDGDLDIVSVDSEPNLGPPVTGTVIWQNPLPLSNPFAVSPWNYNMIETFAPWIQFSVAAGDLDNDGDVDVAAGGLAGFPIRIWNNTNSSGGDPWVGPWAEKLLDVCPSNASIELSDLDNDGDLDIVCINEMDTNVWAIQNPHDPSTVFNEPFEMALMWPVNIIGSVEPTKRLLSIVSGDLDNDGDNDVVTGDFSPGMIGTHNITVWTNGLVEGIDPWMAPWMFEGYPFFSGMVTGGINALALGDLDNRYKQAINKGGDLDILHLVMNTPHLWFKENLGAQVTETVFPTSTPPAPPYYDIIDSANESLMRIDVIHNGVSWDNDTELATWHFLFDEGGVPLNSGEIDNLFLDFFVFRDVDGNDIWSAVGDAAGDTGAVPAILPGRVMMSFPESSINPNVIIQADLDETYFFVVELESDASIQSPNTWNVTFEPDGYRPGDWNEVEHEDEDTILTVQDRRPTTAGVFRAVGGAIDNDPPRISSVFLNGMSTLNYAICSNPPPGSVTLTAIIDDTLEGNSNVTGANYTTSPMGWPGTPMDPTDGAFDSPMEFANISIDISGLGVGTYYYYVYGWDEVPNYNNTGPFATLVIADDCPPEIGPVLIDGLNTATYSVCTVSTIDLTSSVNDTGLGDSSIGGANYTIGAQNWPGMNMDPTDGAFDSAVEGVNLTIDVSTWGAGFYEFYVYGWDSIPNNNTTSVQFALLTLIDDCPPIVENVLLNGLPSLTIALGGGPVWVNATLNDTTTGNANIASANYTIGMQNWPGTPMNAVVPPFDNPVEDVTNDPAPIDTSMWAIGTYDICVYGNDTLGNNNTTGACAVLTISPELMPPEIYDVWIDGSPAQSYGISSLPPTFVLTAVVDDEAMGASFIGNVSLGGANYTLGPANWPSSQPMNAVDGTWEDDIAENVTVTVPTPTTPGVYVYCVYGWDQWFNYNTTGACATLTIQDDLPPEISNVLLDGLASISVVVGTLSVDLTALLSENNTGQSNIGGANYTVGAQAWGTAVDMDPTDGAWDSMVENANKTIDISTWGVGPYQICVYGWDSAAPQNNNVTGDCAQLAINPAGDNPPTIEAWVPGGTFGENYNVGDIIIVTWTASDDNPLPATPINITYGVPGSWTDIALNEANDGTHSWDTTGVPCPNTYWMNLSVYDSIGQTTFDESNNSFTIWCAGDSTPMITAWEPGGTSGQSFAQGATINVTWTASDDNPLPANPINITYGDAGGWTTVASNEANDGLYAWDTSSEPCGTYWMNITVYDSAGQESYDVGNNSFNITCPPTEPPVIVSVVPNPASQTVGQSVTITVTVTDADTNMDDLTVTVEIRTPSGTLLDNFTMTYDPGTNTFTHTGTFDLEGTYTLLVWAVDPDGNSDSEPGTFGMEAAPPSEEYNWKPVIALAFTLILLFLGLMASFGRPIGFKGDLKKDRLMTFLGGVLPFVIAESATGVISLATGLLSIPPISGAGLIVDVAILVIGILLILAILMKGKPSATYGAEPQEPEGDAGLPPPPSEGEAIGVGDQEATLPPPPEEGATPPEPAGDEGVPPPPPPPPSA
jgi:hypothetical protein